MNTDLDATGKRVSLELAHVREQIANYVDEMGLGNRSDAIRAALERLEREELPRLGAQKSRRGTQTTENGRPAFSRWVEAVVPRPISRSRRR